MTAETSSIRQLIAENKLEAALDQLSKIDRNSLFLNAIPTLKSEYVLVNIQYNSGLMNIESLRIALNGLSLKVLNLLTLLEQSDGQIIFPPSGRVEQQSGASVSENQRVYQPSAIQPILTPPGAVPPSVFMGREKEIADLRRLLTQYTSPILLYSDAGMGKTTLAAAYWEQHRDTYSHLAWVFCEGGLLTAVRDQLGESLNLKEELNRFTGDLDRQLQAIKTCMANLGRNCLLILDHANEPDQIQSALSHLSGLGWHIIITSRCSNVMPDEQHEYLISNLSPEDARTLFKKRYSESNSDFDELLDRFLSAVGYNTLCIEIYSKNLREGNAWGLNLETLLSKLQNEGLVLSADDSFEIRTAYRKEAASTNVIIQTLYNVELLSEEETKLLVLFALLPAESHSPLLLVKLMAPGSRTTFRNLLDGLAKKGWLRSDRESYRISPVVQKIILQKHADHRWPLAIPLVKRLINLFKIEGTHTVNMQEAAPFAHLILGFVENLGVANDELAELLKRLWVYYKATGNISKSLDTALYLEKLCERFSFKRGLALAYSRLGRTYTNLGNYEKACEYHYKGVQVSEEVCRENPDEVILKSELGIAYGKLGHAYELLNRLDEAVAFYEKDNQISIEIYQRNPKATKYKYTLAISYSRQAVIYITQKEFAKALELIEKKTVLLSELTKNTPSNASYQNSLAMSYEQLGDVYAGLDNAETALKNYELGCNLELELYEKFPQNIDYKNGLAISCYKMGILHQEKLNHPEQADACFRKAEQLWEELLQNTPDDFQIIERLNIIKKRIKI